MTLADKFEWLQQERRMRALKYDVAKDCFAMDFFDNLSEECWRDLAIAVVENNQVKVMSLLTENVCAYLDARYDQLQQDGAFKSWHDD